MGAGSDTNLEGVIPHPQSSSPAPHGSPLETSTVPGLRLTGRHKVRPLGEPILTFITGDPGAWFKLYHIVKSFVKPSSAWARLRGLLWTWTGLCNICPLSLQMSKFVII